MKIIAINTSPSKNGNCGILLDEAIKGAQENGNEVIKYDLTDLNINCCKACNACATQPCIQDDDAKKIITEIENADAVIFATPIWFGYMSSLAKVFTDRFYQVFLNEQRNFSGKAAFIITSSAPENIYGDIDNQITGPFTSLGLENTGMVHAGEAPMHGAVKDKEEEINKAYSLGKNL
ncbi:MAG: flavodoxin family protein [Methanosphaera stadtmanae]|nr:flavodoxin family protein [Methanosphaera stadtmanae]